VAPPQEEEEAAETASRSWRIDARDKPGGERVLPNSALASALSLATVGGVAGTVSSALLPKRHCLAGTEADAFGSSSVADDSEELSTTLRTASRACRKAARDRPGGEPNDGRASVATGVAGIVSSAVVPKRHCLFGSRRPPELDTPEELSVSEALPGPPTSVVSPSSSKSSMVLNGTSAVFMQTASTMGMLSAIDWNGKGILRSNNY